MKETNTDKLFREKVQQWEDTADVKWAPEMAWERLEQRLGQQGKTTRIIRFRYLRPAAAAVLLLVVLAGMRIYRQAGQGTNVLVQVKTIPFELPLPVVTQTKSPEPASGVLPATGHAYVKVRQTSARPAEPKQTTGSNLPQHPVQPAPPLQHPGIQAGRSEIIAEAQPVSRPEAEKVAVVYAADILPGEEQPPVRKNQLIHIAPVVTRSAGKEPEQVVAASTQTPKRRMFPREFSINF